MEELLKELAKNPEEIKGIIEGYKPVLYLVAGEIFGMIKDLANNEEFFNTFATADKNQYDALINVGFSKNQAMAIMLHDMEELKTVTSSAKVKG